MIKHKRHKIITLFLLIFTILGNYSIAHAQKSSSAMNTEEVAIAFYKTGDIIPNFEKWIKKQAPYKDTPWARRTQIYDQEMLRLQSAYQAFDPDKDYLIVKTITNVILSKSEDEEKKPIYSIQARFAEAPEALYFPYDFLGERIIVMPYLIETIMNNTLEKAQYDSIKNKLGRNEKLTTVIRMKPFKADFTQPYLIDGLEQWVFKTKIASIEYWNNDSELIWEYTAPWYISPHILDIKNLYGTRPANSNKGTVKPVTNIP